MVMEGYGRHVRTAGDPTGADTVALRAGIGYLKRLLELPDPLKPAKEITIELWDGERASVSRAAGMLRAEGFRGGPGQSMVYDGY
jgi:hypothetical protein